MKVRATLRVRNDAMISARKRLGMSQKQCSAMAEVSMTFVQNLEKFDYSYPKTPAIFNRHAANVADLLGLEIDEVIDEELIGRSMIHEVSAVSEIGLLQLTERLEARALLPNPEDALFAEEEAQIVRAALAQLPHQQQEIIKSRMGFDDEPVLTYEELGVKMKKTRERVRQLEGHGLRRMHHILSKTQYDSVFNREGHTF